MENLFFGFSSFFLQSDVRHLTAPRDRCDGSEPAWRSGAPLRRGVWDIPIPAERRVVRPTALLVPLVGFDRLGFRLGYGGGYYDRTLAAMDPKPLTIGFGYELGRLETIYPQPHDIPMDAVVTEAGLVKSPPWRADAALVQPFPGLFGETFAVGLAVVEDGDAPGVPALGEKIARDLA